MPIRQLVVRRGGMTRDGEAAVAEVRETFRQRIRDLVPAAGAESLLQLAGFPGR